MRGLDFVRGTSMSGPHRRWRIAQVASLHESVLPQLYGGTERIVSYLTEALVELDHDVTLFASGDSHTGARWSRAARVRCGSRASPTRSRTTS